MGMVDISRVVGRVAALELPKGALGRSGMLLRGLRRFHAEEEDLEEWSTGQRRWLSKDADEEVDSAAD